MGLERADISALARPEAGNGDSGRRRLLDAVLPGAVKTTIKLFLSERGAELGGDNSALREQLEQVGGETLSADRALGLPVVHLQHAIQFPEVDPIWAAASVVAERSQQGASGAWRVVLPRPRRLRFGPWVSPLVTAMEAHPIASGLGVRYDEGDAVWREFSLEALDGSWQRLPLVTLLESSTVITPSAPSDALWVTAEPAFTAAPLPEVVGVVEGAVAQIRRFAPEYLPWIDRVVRHIVPILAPREISVSRSIKGHHGVVYASFPSNVAHTAEVLVHEAAHQYINILEHVAFVADLFEDEKLYFSPYVKKDRTIDRILFGYHAFANVLLFHRRCLAGGIELSSYTGNDLAEQERLLGVLQGYLRGSPGLSAVGRTIFEPLDEAIGTLAPG